MKTKINKIIIFSIVLLALGACKTKKIISKTELPHDMLPAEMVKKIQDKQPAFTTADVHKMSVDVDLKERQLTVNATLKMVTDSAIHLSVQPFFGIELFKLELTPRNFVLIDKTNKTYYEGGYSLFKSRFGVDVDFYSIQSMISNRLFVVGNRAFLADVFKWRNDSISSQALTVQGETLKQEVVVDATLERITKMILKTKDNNNTVVTEYSGFKEFDKLLFPGNIYVNAENAKSKASFHFTVEQVEFDEPLVLQAANLSRYRRGDINRFMKK